MGVPSGALPKSGDGEIYSATTTKLAQERLKRLKHQNKKLVLEISEKTGRVVSADDLKREVLAANATVKQQLLAIPYRECDRLASETNPAEVARILTAVITEALNDLAYERGNVDAD